MADKYKANILVSDLFLLGNFYIQNCFIQNFSLLKFVYMWATMLPIFYPHGGPDTHNNTHKIGHADGSKTPFLW